MLRFLLDRYTYRQFFRRTWFSISSPAVWLFFMAPLLLCYDRVSAWAAAAMMAILPVVTWWFWMGKQRTNVAG